MSGLLYFDLISILGSFSSLVMVLRYSSEETCSTLSPFTFNWLFKNASLVLDKTESVHNLQVNRFIRFPRSYHIRLRLFILLLLLQIQYMEVIIKSMVVFYEYTLLLIKVGVHKYGCSIIQQFDRYRLQNMIHKSTYKQ